MRRPIALLLLAWAVFVGRVACADGIPTDANIVTGLDFSGSIDPHDAQVQIDGITMAIRSPQIIAAIKTVSRMMAAEVTIAGAGRCRGTTT